MFYLHGGQFLLHLPVLVSEFVVLVLELRQAAAQRWKNLIPLHQLLFDVLHLQTQNSSLQLPFSTLTLQILRMSVLHRQSTTVKLHAHGDAVRLSWLPCFLTSSSCLPSSVDALPRRPSRVASFPGSNPEKYTKYRMSTAVFI